MSQSLNLFAVLASLLLAFPQVVSAQPGGGGRGFGDRGGGIVRLLMSEDVRQEIELVDEQQAELEAMRDEIREEMRGRMQEMFAGVRELGPEARRERMQEARAEMELMRADIEKRVEGVLMPHQMERLRQIELQQKLRTRGAASLASGKLAEQLGLSAEQQERLQTKAAEVQAELRVKIEKLRQEAREKVLSVLTSEQRAKLDSMTGAEFTLPEQGPQRRGRRGGGRGQ